MKAQTPVPSHIPTVAELIKARSAAASSPGARTDSFHLALVIEGGGMRGVIANGMTTALEELKLLAVFDSVHGSSAGAAAGAYFLSEQAKMSATIYYEDINNETFISYRRVFLGKPVMNIGFLIDHVFRTIKPLAAEKIVTSSIPLNIVMTDAASGHAHIQCSFRSPHEVFEALRATTTIPILAGPPIALNDKRIFDGGIAQQIPIQSAMAGKATHVLVLLTRDPFRPQNALSQAVEASLLGLFYGTTIRNAYLTRSASIDDAVRACLCSSTQRQWGTAVRPVYLRCDVAGLDRLTTDARLLRRGADEGYRALTTSLGA